MIQRLPVDLGSRCTVFMNSKIKASTKKKLQCWRYFCWSFFSVVKNAIQKSYESPWYENSWKTHCCTRWEHSTNDAVLRSFEILVGQNVIRPNISGLMGAYGVALLSKEQYLKLNLDM